MPKKKATKLDEVKLFDTEEGNLNFPEICKFIRRTFKVTQEQMAQKLNITTTAYAYWEYGRYVPKGSQAFNLCLLYLHAKEELLKEKKFEDNSLESSVDKTTTTSPIQNQAA